MTIIRNDNKGIDFNTLEIGDVFKDQDNVFMVIKKIESKNGSVYNAIDLDDGELTLFYADEEVIPLKAELVVS